MRAVVEEGDETLACRMQRLALSEAALPRHLLTALYTKKSSGKFLRYIFCINLIPIEILMYVSGSGGDGRLLLNRQLSRKLVALWTSNNVEALELFQRILPAGLLGFLDSNDKIPDTAEEELGEGVPNRDNLKVIIK